ncbi:tryptophan halogenase [Colwellia sp. 75C3]|uniref:tryptophan halogenase family protein n=1 Tax=Colwellia sp. 75C3 TaxID=888425 RepID=UPI000C346167|nr:tryptophan halogenase family protein [Colwellia sp. 75C3]PKG86244.1 tryptophan halogenase [Colwellia sp. 75C3]
MQPKSIVIVGGGTAGWMAANLMAKKWRNSNIDITLVESPDIGIIGVGEGSTPQLKAFFDKMDIAEHEWMPQCNATYKLGINFKNWSTKKGFEQYFHPFDSALDLHTRKKFILNCYGRRLGDDVKTLPNDFFIAAYLAKQNLGPHANSNFPFPVNYGYHFDSHLLGKFLCDKAIELGVEHISGNVTDVALHLNGDIEKLSVDSVGWLSADFFIDSTGFRSLLLQNTLKVPFVNFKENLFNNSAVIIPSPSSNKRPPQTTSTALKNGWAWDIPLTNRTGNGYVYSSDFCSSEEAEIELREKLNLLDSDVEARHLKMKVGRVEQHWAKNCLAVGLSQGFIEPLEATALHLVQETIEHFISAWDKGNFTNTHAAAFNKNINQRFDGIRDYIVCHYKLNSRTDSEYWQQNARNTKTSGSLAEIINVWLNREDLAQYWEQSTQAKSYSVVSWHCILSGYGIFPELNQKINTQAMSVNMDEVHQFLSQCSRNFPDHTQQLNNLLK